MEILIIIGVIVILIWLFGGNSSDNNKLPQQEQPKVQQKKESDILLYQQQEREEKKKQEELALRKLKDERERREREQYEKKRNDWKTNWQDFQLTLQQNKIMKLYHFTDKSNIDSIKQNGGLYSWYYCNQNDIAIPKSGGDDISKSLDMRYGLQDYVRLSFTKNHPMMYVAKKQGRIFNPIILEISNEVVFWKETRFSDMNATKTGHSQGETIDDFKRIRFNIVKQNNHFDLQDDDKPYYQAEVMIKTFIPIEFITNINQI